MDAGDPNSPFKALLFSSVGTSQNVSEGPAYKGRFKKTCLEICLEIPLASRFKILFRKMFMESQKCAAWSPGGFSL